MWAFERPSHRASRCSVSLRKLVWNLCKGSKFGKMRLFKASGMASSLLTVLWNHEVMTSRSFRYVLSVVDTSLAMKYALSVGNLFLRPSSSSSVRGHAWSFSSGLTKGEDCLVSGLRLGDKITLAGTAPPWELMDSSERWGLPVREPIWGWEVLKKKKSNSFWDQIATYNSPPYQIFKRWLPFCTSNVLHDFLLFLGVAAAFILKIP